MTDNITLPRAAEQARKALELALESQFAPDDAECEHGMHYRDCPNDACVMRDCKAALAALDAALAEEKETFAQQLTRRSWEAHRAALAEPEKERAETGIPARSGVEGKIDTLTGEAYRTPQPDAKPEPYTLAELFAQFAAKQRPLDADMAAIINANLDSLYITDEPAAALAEPDAKREPATVEQIDEEYIGPVIDARWHDFEAGFRAAERFHGIGGSK
jgi:hypothetical protein